MRHAEFCKQSANSEKVNNQKFWKVVENGFVWRFEQKFVRNILSTLYWTSKAGKTPVVSMFESSPYLPRMQRKENVLLWRTNFEGILQDYRTIVECQRLEVQMHQYQKWMPRSLCWKWTQCFRSRMPFCVLVVFILEY